MRKTTIERFNDKIDRSGECHEWTGQLHKSGYAYFYDGTRLTRAHRFAWEQVNGPIPDGLFVLHKCDNRRCVRVDHLYLGNQIDNMKDRAVRERNAAAKLTAADVRAIRAHTGTIVEIGQDFGITKQNVSLIRNRKAWIHVE